MSVKMLRMARSGVLAVADLAVLLALRPNPSGLVRDLTAPHVWVARAGADGAAIELAAATLWCTAAWLALGLLACLGGTLPGAAGRCGHRIARTVLPIAVYRLAAGAAGVGVCLAPVAAGAASTPPPAPPSAGAPLTLSYPGLSGPTAAGSPEWPTDSPLPAPAWPTSGRPHGQVPSHHSPYHRRQSHRPPQRPAGPDPAGHAVVVRTGDSLWTITAANLPASASDARIARSWPRWYAVNRAVIGANPALLVPGQTLHAPAHTQADRP